MARDEADPVLPRVFDHVVVVEAAEDFGKTGCERIVHDPRHAASPLKDVRVSQTSPMRSFQQRMLNRRSGFQLATASNSSRRKSSLALARDARLIRFRSSSPSKGKRAKRP